MSKTHEFIAVLALSLIGLGGFGYEPLADWDVNPTPVAEMRKAVRDLWVGHIFWIQHAVSNNAANNQEKRDSVEKEVGAYEKQIASTITPFYGEAVSQEFLNLLNINYGAIQAYSEATVARDKRRQHASLARLGSNADDIDDFLSHLNPYLQKDIIRGLSKVHSAHHIFQINQYKEKELAPPRANWPMMRQHAYVIADTLTTALVTKFPSKFS
ncbi:MAG: hypothetical protein ABI604_15695 [Nitrospirota bacterium]